MPDRDCLTTLIRHLATQGATEATAVADVLENLLDSDDPDMIETPFVIAVLEELIGWATSAKARITGSDPCRPEIDASTPTTDRPDFGKERMFDHVCHL